MDIFEAEEQERRGWLCALRRQGMRGLTFNAELNLAEQATRDGRWEQAELHLTTSIQRLKTEGLDYPRWTRCIEAYVDLHLERGRPDLALQVLHFAAVDMSMREGPEHHLTRHFESRLSNLYWAKACSEGECMESLMGAGARLNFERPQDHQEMIEVVAQRHRSWDRCLDYSGMCLAHGQLYWAEVACWAAMMLSGGSADPRFLETVDRLCAVYMQANAPSFAEATTRWAIRECQETLGNGHAATCSLFKKLEACLTLQGRQEELENLRREMNG